MRKPQDGFSIFQHPLNRLLDYWFFHPQSHAFLSTFGYHRCHWSVDCALGGLRFHRNYIRTSFQFNNDLKKKHSSTDDICSESRSTRRKQLVKNTSYRKSSSATYCANFVIKLYFEEILHFYLKK